MTIYKVNNKNDITHLYEGWEETMIYSCLQDYMGEAYATMDKCSAQIYIAGFCFYAGKPSLELIQNKIWDDFAIIVTQSDEWDLLIEQNYSNITKRERYATHKDVHHFDVNVLKNNINVLPSQYELKQIDEYLYHQILKENWSIDLCGQFQTYQDYLSNGIGFVIMEGKEIVAGVSSYTVYKGGIEVEIDTRKDKRRQGLARICASKMILECLNRDIYPSWDAHNKESLALAESLGYVFDKSYTVYEFIE